MADGLTDEDGDFRLSTYAAFDGVPAGEYVVTIVQTGGYERGEAGAKNTLPAKYSDPKTSPLKVTIQEGENTTAFELTR